MDSLCSPATPCQRKSSGISIISVDISRKEACAQGACCCCCVSAAALACTSPASHWFLA